MQTEIANASPNTNATAIPIPLADTAASLLALPVDEFKKSAVPALIVDYAGYSDAGLEQDFLMYKQLADDFCTRGIRGQASPGDLALMENIVAVARCPLTVAYRRGLQWALDEVHKTRPIATA
jgi:hypothetical protein